MLTSCLQSLVQHFVSLAVEQLWNLLLDAACTDQLLLGIGFDGALSLQAPTSREDPEVVVCSVWSCIRVIGSREIVKVDRLWNAWRLSVCLNWLSLHRSGRVEALKLVLAL